MAEKDPVAAATQRYKPVESTVPGTTLCPIQIDAFFGGGVPPGMHLTIYGPKALQIHAVPSNEADEFYQTNLGGLLTPPTGMDRAKDWRGLNQERQLLIKYDELDRPACDVAISGLGWVAIEPKSSGNPELVLEEEEKEMHFSVCVFPVQ